MLLLTPIQPTMANKLYWHEMKWPMKWYIPLNCSSVGDSMFGRVKFSYSQKVQRRRVNTLWGSGCSRNRSQICQLYTWYFSTKNFLELSPQFLLISDCPINCKTAACERKTASRKISNETARTEIRRLREGSLNFSDRWIE